MDKCTVYPSLGFLIAVVLIAAGYWIAPLLVSPQRSANETILFRQAAGDPDYLPQVAATARLNIGETSVIEQAGQGVRSFPVTPILTHALLFRCLGDAGFLLADILVTLAYAFTVRYFLYKTGIAPGIAELLSIVVVSGMARWMVEQSRRFGLPLPILFWEVRFPRPFVTEAL